MKETIFTLDFRESGEEEEQKSDHKMGASFASAPIKIENSNGSPLQIPLR